MSGHGHSLARDFRADVGSPFVETPVDREHGGNIYAWALTTGIDANEIIDFSASINAIGPPASARQAFLKSYREISRYPDPHGTELKQALAKWHTVEPDEVLLGNGSTQLIYLICTTLRLEKALIVGPAFSEYANALRLAGTKICFFSLPAESDFKFSTERFMATWEKDHDIVFLTTPNSVTGQLIPRTELEKIAHIAFLRKTFVVIDEAFIDFVETESVKGWVRENPYLVVLRSLTKYYSLPGLRLDYLLAQVPRIKQFEAHHEPWSVNGPAQRVALACLTDASHIAKTDRWLQRERSFLARGLAALPGLRVYPSSTNFLLVKIDNDHADALQLRSFLLRKKLLIRPCNSFLGIGTAHFRVAVRRRTDNRLLLEALKEWTA